MASLSVLRSSLGGSDWKRLDLFRGSPAVTSSIYRSRCDARNWLVLERRKAATQPNQVISRKLYSSQFVEGAQQSYFVTCFLVAFHFGEGSALAGLA